MEWETRYDDGGLTSGGGFCSRHWAAIFGFVETARLLELSRADLNAQSKSGETPLHMSAEKGKVEFVKFLLQHGADKTILATGVTAFEYAKRNGHKETATLLAGPGKKGCCSIL